MPLLERGGYLPSLKRLRTEGIQTVSSLPAGLPTLRIALVNLMPDAAVAATERQFFRLLGNASGSGIGVIPYCIFCPGIQRSDTMQAFLKQHYLDISELAHMGLDGLIVTGTVPGADLTQEAYWPHLTHIFDFIAKTQKPTLCACLATHLALQYYFDLERKPNGYRLWGVFEHRCLNPRHPLLHNCPSVLSVPHSRLYGISAAQMQSKNIEVLIESDVAGVHCAYVDRPAPLTLFQGHPEYDRVSLLKEYKRELGLSQSQRLQAPTVPQHYLSARGIALLHAYIDQLQQGQTSLQQFPETQLSSHILHDWSAQALLMLRNWMLSLIRW